MSFSQFILTYASEGVLSFFASAMPIVGFAVGVCFVLCLIAMFIYFLR